MLDRRLHGRLLYRDAAGGVTGEERFTIGEHGDGSRTLQAMCRMDDVDLVRTAMLVLDGEGLPHEAHVRIVEGGRHKGSAFYRFGEDAVEAVLAPSGDTLRLQTDRPPRFFGTHSLVNDAWLALLGSGLAPGGTRMLENLVTCSLRADGGGQPGLFTTSAELTLVGEEPRKTAAGSFDCRHYAVRYGDYPALHMWTAGSLDVLVWMEWSHLAGNYELAELRES